MQFCTAINCMDGRIQTAVISYLQKRFDRLFVDMITEAGPNRILAEQTDRQLIDSLLSRIRISLQAHQSQHIAVIGHHDCAGNPNPKATQIKHIQKSINFLKQHFRDVQIIGLWVNEKWQVEEIRPLAADV